MIKVKFSEVPIGSEFFSISDTNGSTPLIKKESLLYRSSTIRYNFDPDEELVWISKFKDRFGKDLSIGDRIFVAPEGNNEGNLVEKTISDIKISSIFRNLLDRYDIISGRGNVLSTTYAIHYSNIIKIEPEWGV